MLRFTRHYEDTIQKRLMIFISFCCKFTHLHVRQKYQNGACFDKVIAKNKMVNDAVPSIPTGPPRSILSGRM